MHEGKYKENNNIAQSGDAMMGNFAEAIAINL